MKSLLAAALMVFTLAASALPTQESVVYTVNGETYEGAWYQVAPGRPTVLLAHDWDGLTDYEIQRALMLNKLGYNVFAVDLFGQGIRPEKVEDKRQHTGALYKDREKLRALMQGGLEQAIANGADPASVVVMGYCFGGAAVLEAARAGMPAQGFVTFHGGLQTPAGQDYSQVSAPLLIMHGTADTAITMADFADLASRLEKAGVAHEMITYGGAQHAFTVFGGGRYHKEADLKSWARFQQFLQAVTVL
ncbi:MAG: dienelactone hydrolase [Oceanospirillaceae bacterium]|nr:dienelactone hydrolase [Oceanospirillaceae bacterium]MBT12683.1 dienelactone hydrolase [Oceanospirillaceae bacterium]